MQRGGEWIIVVFWQCFEKQFNCQSIACQVSTRYAMKSMMMKTVRIENEERILSTEKSSCKNTLLTYQYAARQLLGSVPRRVCCSSAKRQKPVHKLVCYKNTKFYWISGLSFNYSIQPCLVLEVNRNSIEIDLKCAAKTPSSGLRW